MGLESADTILAKKILDRVKEKYGDQEIRIKIKKLPMITDYTQPPLTMELTEQDLDTLQETINSLYPNYRSIIVSDAERVDIPISPSSDITKGFDAEQIKPTKTVNGFRFGYGEQSRIVVVFGRSN